MSKETKGMIFIAVFTAVVGGFFGQAAADHTSGVVAGGLSGAVTGVVYELLMRRVRTGKVLTFLTGAGLGGASGTFSGALAHLPSHMMGLKGGMFTRVEFGAVFGLCVGVVVGAILSFRYPT